MRKNQEYARSICDIFVKCGQPVVWVGMSKLASWTIVACVFPMVKGVETIAKSTRVEYLLMLVALILYK